MTGSNHPLFNGRKHLVFITFILGLIHFYFFQKKLIRFFIFYQCTYDHEILLLLFTVEEAINAANWGLGPKHNAPTWNEEQQQQQQPNMMSHFQHSLVTSPQPLPIGRGSSPAPGLMQPQPQKFTSPPQHLTPNAFIGSTQSVPFIPTMNSNMPTVNTSPQIYQPPHVLQQQTTSQSFRAFTNSPQPSPLSSQPYTVTSPKMPFTPIPQRPGFNNASNNSHTIQNGKIASPQPMTMSQMVANGNSGSRGGSPFQTGTPFSVAGGAGVQKGAVAVAAATRSASPWQNDISRLKQSMSHQSDYSESESDNDGPGR